MELIELIMVLVAIAFPAVVYWLASTFGIFAGIGGALVGCVVVFWGHQVLENWLHRHQRTEREDDRHERKMGRGWKHQK